MGKNSFLEPLEINNIILPNRIVFPAFQANYATSEGFVTERLLKMYGKIASGGSGLVIAGGMAVSDDGTPNTNAIKINDDRQIPGLKDLFSVIKKNGSVAGAQLMHAGRQTVSIMTGHPVVAASAIPCPVMKEMPLELDNRGIKRIQDDFVNASARAKESGADLIELHGAFGYLIGGFLSPFSNKRRDEYGKDSTLFFTEIIERVKREVGNMPVSCRISGDEFVEGGLTIDQTRKIAPRLVEAGADLISVGAGTYASMKHMVPTKDMGEGVHVYLAKAIRDVVDVPVICSDNIRSIGFADKIISEKRADLVAICRPQVADPFFVKKSINNQPYKECLDCGKCLYFLRGEKSVSCTQNSEL
ncbi:MAG: NADH:flavin oxidoreductase [Candidatus Methanoperedens sp.]|nr:NADH:flavin oxidoreductase [Candidatus Methanoperedens sp.]